MEVIDTKAVADAVIEKSREAISDIKRRNNELEDRVLHLEQRGVGSDYSGRGVLSIGEQVVASEQFKSLVAGSGSAARIEVKTAIVNATGQNQPLVQGHRFDGIVHGGERRFTMRDLLAVAPTDSNLVEFAKEQTYTNNAGPQIGGSPEQYENVTKPESAMTFTLETAAVTTLAHWIPVSRQVLGDSPALASYLDRRLMYGLKLKEDQQILLGTGSSAELPGLYTNRTAYASTSPVTYNTKLDVLRDAMAQVEASDYLPNGVVLNPEDWKEIQLAKDSQLRYIFGDPANSNEPRLWGLPVVATNTMTAGTFLVGAFDMAAQLWDRQMATIEIGLNNDNFTKNMVTILCEERLALTIYRADALVGGSFTAS